MKQLSQQWGMAKRQVEIHAAMIVDLYQEKRSMRAVFFEMKKRGVIDMSERSFIRCARKIISAEPPSPLSELTSKTPPQNSEDGQLRRPSEFSFNPTPASNEWEDE